jgi:hypothetical protein
VPYVTKVFKGHSKFLNPILRCRYKIGLICENTVDGPLTLCISITLNNADIVFIKLTVIVFEIIFCTFTSSMKFSQ